MKAFLRYFVIASVVTSVEIGIALVFSNIFAKLDGALVQFGIAVGFMMIANIALACLNCKEEKGESKEE